MAKLLMGAPLAAAMTNDTLNRANALKERGITPTLCLIRVGNRPDDISYENGAKKRAHSSGIEVKSIVLPDDISEADFEKAFSDANNDDSIHGIQLFRPLPGKLDSERIKSLLSPEKDIDGWTDASAAGVFLGTDTGFTPCTAQAVIEMLDFYGYDVSGKRAVVIGRSPIVGRPLGMLLMHRNATVTICHTRTVDTEKIAREADILVAAAGKLRAVTADYLKEGQVVIDVGINWDEAAGHIAGDVDTDAAEKIVKAVSPVPGGVGAITSTVLCRHVVEAAERRLS